MAADMGPGKSEDYLSFFKSMVTNINSASTDVLFLSLGELLNNPKIKAKLGDHLIQRYIYAVGLLSFTSREVTRENVKSVLITVGEEPDDRLLDVLFSAKPEGHLIYLYSLFFLLVMGQKPDAAGLARLVKALGVPPNLEAAEQVLTLFNQKYA